MKDAAAIEEAVQHVMNIFPFGAEYMRPEHARYQDVAATVLRYLKPGSTILDFGCGPCDKTAVLQSLGFRCSACDDLEDDWHKIPGNRDKILTFANELGIDFKQTKEELLGDAFDMIMLLDVLEHLHDSPRDLLNDLLELTKPDGLLLVTVPNAVNVRKRISVLFGKTNLPGFEGFYWYPGAWRGHVREYVRDDLVLLSRYLNLDVLELRSCDFMLGKLPTGLRSAYVLATNLFRGFKDSWLLVSRKRQHWEPKKTVQKDELYKILRKSTPYHYKE